MVESRLGCWLNHRQTLKMFLTNLPWLGKAFLLTTTIAMVESLEECCTEKMVGSVSYTLLDAAFHGELPHQCLNDCVYTVSGTSSPKFCFQRGDLPTECLSDVPEIELVGGSGPNEGNLMLHGQPVCDDLWGHNEAMVVCRQLGYLYGSPTDQSFFGDVSDNFAMDNVQCTGDEEYIWGCIHLTEHNCGGHEAAGVICSNEPPMMTTGDQGSGSPELSTAIFTADPGTGSGSVSGAGSVDVRVHVADASSNVGVADASVEFTLGELDLVLTSTTDDQGWAVFTLSSGTTGVATIVVSREGYVTATTERLIDSETDVISVFSSPELAEGEHRLVLSWETSMDLDVYALQKNKTTGEIVCKTWYSNPG